MYSLRNLIAGAAALFVLMACEAPLVLDGVKAQRREPTRRADLLQAAAGNGETLVVVGAMGVVLVSPDGGRTWQRRELQGKPFLMDVAACPDGGYAALAYERSVWIGDRAGREWRHTALALADAPQALTCDPEGRIWVVGGFSAISHSADKGASWTTTSLEEDVYLTTIQFVDPRTAIITGEFGVVIRSTDGGGTWARLKPLPGEFYPQAAWFRSADDGWVVGLDGTVLHTVDGARTWTRESTDGHAPIYGIAEREGRLYAVGANGRVLRYATGRWTRVRHGLPIRAYLRAVLPVGERGVLVAGGAGALHLVSEP